MSRYHVDTAGALEIVRQAINTAWRATPAGSVVTHLYNGVPTHTEPVELWEARHGYPAGHASQLVKPESLIVVGADAALDLSPVKSRRGAMIDDHLGVGIVPPESALVQVSRPREHGRLPTGVRDLFDDRYIDDEWSKIGVPSGHASEAVARAFITAELQGARATAALARKDARGSQAALERALGIR